jgi:NitT/TauT family transport system permease protein
MCTPATQLKSFYVPIVTVFGLLALWQLADLIFGFDKLILPSPIEIASAFIHNPGKLFTETGITMTEAFCGFVLGSVGAYLLAIVFVHSPNIQKAVYPYAVALKSTPLVAIAPLLVVWFGNGMLSKIVMSALVAFFPVLVNSVTGLANIDSELLDLMKSLSATHWEVLFKVRIPNSLGYLFAALKTASSMAVVGAVIGEYTGATEGVGHLINTSSYYLDTPLMFAGIVSISVSGMLFFSLIGFLEKKVVFWQQNDNT